LPGAGLWKHKLFSLINIFGLSVGIAFTLLIAVYVWQERSVNSQLRNAGNQYIIQSKWKTNGLGYDFCTLAALPQALRINYPRLVANYYHWDGVSWNISRGDRHFRESLQIGDGTFIEMYGFKLLYGNAKNALNDPYSAVITEDRAIRYFGKTDVIGQTLSIEGATGQKHDFMVTGVLAKYKKNSVTDITERSNTHIFLPPAAAKFLRRDVESWNNTIIVGFVELQKGVKPADVEKAMKTLIKANAWPQVADNLTPYLVDLPSYYRQNGINKHLLYTLSCIAFFILLMAVINFVNICISRSSQRMREMGIRKVLGGLRAQLIGQFLTEAVLMVLIATLFSLAVYTITEPFFADLLSTEMTGVFAFPLYFYLMLIAFALVIGLIAGLYPALILSSLKSIDSLKGKRDKVKDNVLFRKSLIGFQFATAAIALIAAIIISNQVELFFGKDLGFDKDFVVYAQVPRVWTPNGVQRIQETRYQLSQLNQVKSASVSWEIPDGNSIGSLQAYKTTETERQAFASTTLVTDNKYAGTYNLKVLAGEFFKQLYSPADANLVVINEKQSKALGFQQPKDAIGKQFNVVGESAYTISGVVADFRFGPMVGDVPPLTFVNLNRQVLYRYMSIKLKPGNIGASLTVLQKKWAELMPNAPFEYQFMDSAIAQMYKTEIQLKKASYVATVLAVIIVLLGVLGLISLNIQKKVKEIGIRRVLGSSVHAIILLFLKDFLTVVLLAGVLACPIAYWMMKKWLESYVVKTELTIFPFSVALVSLLIVTTVLIVSQTIKAAIANPVKSLRTE
jgi:putative ABC transport system permease protein